jgi:hypothetical protein
MKHLFLQNKKYRTLFAEYFFFRTRNNVYLKISKNQNKNKGIFNLVSLSFPQ